MIPETLKYTKDHEWVRIEGEEVVIGITDHAQKELGDIVFIELPESGRSLQAGEEMGTVESVKAVSEIYAPLAGQVVGCNTALSENPDQAAVINQDPYGEGWMVRIKVSAEPASGTLLEAAEYKNYLAESGD